MKPMIRKKIAERRSKPRVEGKMRIRVNDEYEEAKIFHGNVSKNGIYIETHDVFAQLNDKVCLEILVPNSENVIRARGKVMRITQPNQLGKPQGIAISFLRMEQKYVNLLDKYIDVLFDGKGVGCRKYPRVATHVLVEVKESDGAYEVVADNLGHGGLFLKMPSEGMEIGERIQIVILHPSSRRKFHVDAEVVHKRSGAYSSNPEFVEGIGVEFVNMNAERRKDLSGFFKSILHYQRRSKEEND